MAKVKRVHFQVPEKVIADQLGYEFLCYCSISLYSAKNEELSFDFAGNSYFEANLLSPFGALIASLKAEKNRVELKNVPSHIEDELIKSGFYKVLGEKNFEAETEATIIDFRKFALEDTASFQDYINDQLLAQKDFPILSDRLKKSIIKSLLEIFNNAHSHGKCEFVYTCGQFYPEEGVLKFAISDMGVTIRKNVNDYFESGSNLDGDKTIEWAVQEGNTTKNGKIPGGLGLSLIRSFLKLNEGSIQIISSNGYWEEKKGVKFANTFKNRFLGTIVSFEFNLNDKKTYKLSSEIDPKNVL
ncbi:hypothetical protein HNQ91_000426 [Filimonas zeae]|uniref:Histidine kinase-, DNA gyrase B-, and HSP90-like ATPase n=1 Tax=Filimonas zeae TaxID=1737353 RepID=A0A917IP31_9BACT|nr:ATP-binding protein [Filimonas zeae]MDR6337404.1 hypothetical protein [Filimonas zeae]GGH58442.1 hypothetical protein GCM10011379_04180 [Filimonas zeae]